MSWSKICLSFGPIPVGKVNSRSSVVSFEPQPGGYLEENEAIWYSGDVVIQWDKIGNFLSERHCLKVWEVDSFSHTNRLEIRV